MFDWHRKAYEVAFKSVLEIGNRATMSAFVFVEILDLLTGKKDH